MNLNTLHKEAAAGNEASKSRLFEQLTVSFRLITQQRIRNRQDAEEVAQEALKTIAEKQMALMIETSFAAWAHKVLEHKLMDFYKSKRVRSITENDLSEQEVPTARVDVDPALVAQLHGCLKMVFQSNKRYARVLALHYQGFETVEICRKLSITSGNMYMMLSRARTSLAACLDGELSE